MIDVLFKFLDEVALIALTYIILTNFGNFIAQKILSKRSRQSKKLKIKYIKNENGEKILLNRNYEIETSFKNGQLIGTLERLTIFIGIVIQEWSLVAVIIALKTIARYRELDDQDKSEYFLIGSLFSMLWAITIALIVFYLIKETTCFEQLKFLVDDKTMNVKIISQ